MSEALYLRDPDQNGIELYWDRPQELWPRTPDGHVHAALDVDELLKEAKRHNQPTGGHPSAAELDELLNEALKQTFPASDPVSIHVEPVHGRK